MEARKKNCTFSMDIAREICTDSFYTVNGGLPRVPLTAVHCDCPLARRKKYDPPLKQILVTASPKFGESEGELGMPDSNENEILFHPKQILMAVSPNLSQCESR